MWCYFDLYNTKFMKLFNCFDFKKKMIFKINQNVPGLKNTQFQLQ